MIHPIFKISEYDIESDLIIVLILAPECFFSLIYILTYALILSASTKVWHGMFC